MNIDPKEVGHSFSSSAGPSSSFALSQVSTSSTELVVFARYCNPGLSSPISGSCMGRLLQQNSDHDPAVQMAAERLRKDVLTKEDLRDHMYACWALYKDHRVVLTALPFGSLNQPHLRKEAIRDGCGDGLVIDRPFSPEHEEILTALGIPLPYYYSPTVYEAAHADPRSLTRQEKEEQARHREACFTRYLTTGEMPVLFTAGSLVTTAGKACLAEYDGYGIDGPFSAYQNAVLRSKGLRVPQASDFM